MTKSVGALFLLLWTLFAGSSLAQRQEIPDALKPWEQWATWDLPSANCPPVFNDAKTRICYWPSQLTLRAESQNATWEIEVQAFEKSWMPLPGAGDAWPQSVRLDGEAAVVVQRDGVPAVELPLGSHNLSGTFVWDRMPQSLAIPAEIGLLSLEVAGQPVFIPDWDERGRLWLQRRQTTEAEKNSMTTQIFRVFEDGIPTWLRTKIQLSVSGQSREEQLGWVLPEGWKLATVNSPIPVAVDDAGRVKAQVRAGKWEVNIDAFQTKDIREIRFSPTAEPAADEELIALKSNPGFRLTELSGIEQVDVTQTMFPNEWRTFPVFRWSTDSTIGIVEKLRGMAKEMPKGLKVKRQIWIDEDGRGATYSDSLKGTGQKIWRLDAADGHDLGAVQVNGVDQLITANPTTGEPGVELRERELAIEAVGRLQSLARFPVVGWQEDVERIETTFNLPPGWRAFALFGADTSTGDWLSAWSLLDLFLLLIFSLSVFRLKGFWAGSVAFLAFGLAYHESGSPRLTWLFLLMPIALLSVVGRGTALKWLSAWKYLAILLLVINLAPFVGTQIQTALFPQLERVGVSYGERSMFGPIEFLYDRSARVANIAFESRELAEDSASLRGQVSRGDKQSTNLKFDPTARIQTGPAQPEWDWNRVYCYWDGPVSADQQIRPILVSRSMNRILIVLRILLLGALTAILLGNLKLRWPSRRSAAVAAMMLGFVLSPVGNPLGAQEIPDEATLKLLRERLAEPSDVFPHAAEIPFVELTVNGNRISMKAEIHAAAEVAVPLPGRLPNWSPLSVSIGDEAAKFISRRNGYLWVVLPAGVHDVTVESLLGDAPEWEWTFLLKPRRVAIEAPDWNVEGVRADGIPDQQVLFSRLQPELSDEAAYDRQDFAAIFVVDRYLETGLTWQIRTEVSRLSSSLKAVSIEVPLLEGENVLSANAQVNNGLIQVGFATGQADFAWVSQLPISDEISLRAADTEQWIERWHLVTSPVWNMTWVGLSPVLESEQQQLVPVWHPWPTEQTTLQFSQPQAVSGETLTVQRVNQSTEIQSRQRSSELTAELKCSLGSDFVLGLGSDAQVTSVSVGGRPIPIQRDGDALTVPVNPGRQVVQVAWKSESSLQTVTQGESIQLPIPGANVTSIIDLPANRWVLWTNGPTHGPAVRFWIFLTFALLAALVLSRIKSSPLGRVEWMLLAIGLTQVHIAAAIVVVAWLFLLAWRGNEGSKPLHYFLFNLRQLLIVFATIISLCILIVVVGSGLLGNPEMYIIGNGSYRNQLKWFQPQIDGELPQLTVISISVWYYRLLMLLWALWLASALLRWLVTGWQHFTQGGAWRRRPERSAPSEPTSEPPLVQS
jgi:hypothetical protein